MCGQSHPKRPEQDRSEKKSPLRDSAKRRLLEIDNLPPSPAEEGPLVAT